jgi:hypothetical protein
MLVALGAVVACDVIVAGGIVGGGELVATRVGAIAAVPQPARMSNATRRAAAAPDSRRTL